MERDGITETLAKRGRGRGRVVMLVDNGVEGDSRVQKAAQSAAEAGWQVILLGVRGASGPIKWKIFEAEVRLLPVPITLAHHTSHRRSLRRPLAYPPGRTASARIKSVRAWQADLRMRLANIELAHRAGASRWRTTLAKGRLLPPRAIAKVLGRWAKFRAGELSRLRTRRANPSSPLNRIPISFWQRLMGTRSWRRMDPSLWNYELAFGPIIDKLRPDLIHAHDFRMIGVGARAAQRARAEGRPVKLLYDAHEFVPGITGRPDPRWLPAQTAYEKEFVPYADAVVTISPTLARLLQKAHGLTDLPAVVLNAPPSTLTEEQKAMPVPDIRELCGVAHDTPLLAYCGGINSVRGVDLMIDALPQLEGVHLALVSLHPSGRAREADDMRERAEELGVADRLHFLRYVPHWQVSRFVAPADAAVSALRHLPNHEIALSNKFFEYSQARLPLVVSDVRTMADVVTDTGQGEVFRADDVEDYVRAVKAVLGDPQRYRAAYDRPGLLNGWRWEAQAEVLDEIYGRLLPGRPRVEQREHVADDADVDLHVELRV
jgi:glycogen(starch) synthase